MTWKGIKQYVDIKVKRTALQKVAKKCWRKIYLKTKFFPVPVPDCVADLYAGEIVHISDGDILVLGKVASLVVPRHLWRRLPVHRQKLQLQHLPGPRPDLVLVQVVPVDDGRDCRQKILCYFLLTSLKNEIQFQFYWASLLRKFLMGELLLDTFSH